jgi:hypothetical protein
MPSLTLEILLPAELSAVTEMLLDPRAMDYCAGPLARPVARRGEKVPVRWSLGDEATFELRLAGLPTPMEQKVRIEELQVEPGVETRLVDTGGGTLFGRWRHQMRATPAESGGTRLVDEVEWSAAYPLPGLSFGVEMLFRQRQRRMRQWLESGVVPPPVG